MENAYSDEASVTCGMPQGSVLGSLLSLLYINNMPQDVDSELLLYVNDSCLVFRHRDRKTIEKHLSRDFLTLIGWFVDSKHTLRSVHFRNGKTKGQIDISHEDAKIKQSSKVAYLGYVLDECRTAEFMTMEV